MTPRLEPKVRTGERIGWMARWRPLGLLVGYRSIQALIVNAVATFIPIRGNLQGGSLVAGASIISTMITVGVIGNRLGESPSGSLTESGRCCCSWSAFA